jgi:hypothetical protein
LRRQFVTDEVWIRHTTELDHGVMKTIRLHAHLLDLAEQSSTTVPSCWCHDLTSGALSYRFSSSSNAYTWDADAVASMPPDIGTEPSTARARELLARWASIRDLLARTERRDPDRLLVAHDQDEMTLIWEREKLALIFGPPDERPQPKATPR